jgi:endonuclease I
VKNFPRFCRTFAENKLKDNIMPGKYRSPVPFAPLLILITLFTWLTYVQGQIPPGYYDPAIGKTGTDLQEALHNIIKDHTSIAYAAIPVYFSSTDAKPGDVVWDMYSDIPGGTPPYVYHYNMGQECGNYNSEGDCYNREHSWPQSWFNEALPMKSDLFHIYPTDGWVNGKRNNYPYGTVSNPGWTSLNGCKLGNCTWPGYTGTVFEPLDEYKGDFARTYFYMSTRYYTEDSGWNATDMTDKSQLKPWALQMMLHWSTADPVSDKETNRNNAVYAIQHNRNPYIDHPEYATLVWGFPAGVDNAAMGNLFLRVTPNPASGECTVELPEILHFTPYTLHLSSIAGVSYSPSTTSQGNTVVVDLHPFRPGIYLLTVETDGGILRGKVILK